MIEVIKQVAVSVIVPTIGRPESLQRMLESLCQQTVKVDEVIVADGSVSEETANLVADQCWQRANLRVKRVAVQPPNAVRQRRAAISVARGELLLFLDDDVILESDCVEHMLALLQADPNIVAVTADFTNQAWPQPTRLWQLYLRCVLKLPVGAWQGRVVGPLLRFGYNPVPASPKPMQWLGSGNSMVRRSAYLRAGGFSDFFLHRCTTNEDVDLGLKISKFGKIVFCPAARMGHFHAPGGRVSSLIAAEDDLYNRYLVMRRTQRRPGATACGLVFLYFSIETASNLGGCLLRFRSNGFWVRLCGRLRALGRILFIARRASSDS